MMRAIDHWRPDMECKFLSYFSRCLQTTMAEASFHRTAKQMKDPTVFAQSLDAPLTDDDDTTLGDITPDSNDPIAAIEEAMYIKSMRKAIDSLLSLLPEKAQRIISEHYFDGKSYKGIADNMQLTYSQLNGIKDRAFHAMRTKIFECPEANFFREYVELNTDYSYHVGAKSFNRTHTSEVEYLVLKRDKLEREALMRMPTYDLPNATKEQLELYQETQKLIMEALHYKHKRYARFR